MFSTYFVNTLHAYFCQRHEKTVLNNEITRIMQVNTNLGDSHSHFLMFPYVNLMKNTLRKIRVVNKSTLSLWLVTGS